MILVISKEVFDTFLCLRLAIPLPVPVSKGSKACPKLGRI